MQVETVEKRYVRYNDVRDEIRRQVLGLSVGERLPAEMALASQMNASRPTVHKAIEELIADGILKRISGQGVFVASLPVLEEYTLCLVYAKDAPKEANSNAMFHQFEIEAAQRNIRVIPAIVSNNYRENTRPPYQGRVDGYILLAGGVNPPECPAVVPLNRNYIVPNASYVLVDDTQGSVLATQYLLSLGHTKLGFVGDLRKIWVHDRLHAMQQTLTTVDAPSPVRVDTHGEVPTQAMLQPLIDAGVTAVASANDQVAMAVISCLHKHGTRVPEDISVIGFDDLPNGAYFVPSLTSMRLPIADIVTTSLDELEQNIRDPENYKPKRIMLPLELVERESCRRL